MLGRDLIEDAAADDAEEELEPQPQGGALKRRHRSEGMALTLPHDPGRRYYTTRTKEGSMMIRPHPAVAVRQDAWKRVVAMLREFGMTPSARTRVAAADAASTDPLEDFFRAGAG